VSLWKAAAASGLIAVIVTITSTVFASGGRMYFAEVVWERVNTMNYRDANDYLLTRSRTVSRWESLRNGSGHRSFWQSMLANGTLYFVVGFAACAVHRRFER